MSWYFSRSITVSTYCTFVIVSLEQVGRDPLWLNTGQFHIWWDCWRPQDGEPAEWRLHLLHPVSSDRPTGWPANIPLQWGWDGECTIRLHLRQQLQSHQHAGSNQWDTTANRSISVWWYIWEGGAVWEVWSHLLRYQSGKAVWIKLSLNDG